eukprot:g45552.t1
MMPPEPRIYRAAIVFRNSYHMPPAPTTHRAAIYNPQLMMPTGPRMYRSASYDPQQMHSPAIIVYNSPMPPDPDCTGSSLMPQEIRMHRSAMVTRN